MSEDMFHIFIFIAISTLVLIDIAILYQFIKICFCNKNKNIFEEDSTNIIKNPLLQDDFYYTKL